MKDGITTAHNWLGLSLVTAIISGFACLAYLASMKTDPATFTAFSAMLTAVLGPLAGGLAGVARQPQAAGSGAMQTVNTDNVERVSVTSPATPVTAPTEGEPDA